jgi:hypothetical protein
MSKALLHSDMTGDTDKLHDALLRCTMNRQITDRKIKEQLVRAVFMRKAFSGPTNGALQETRTENYMFIPMSFVWIGYKTIFSEYSCEGE